ncbi:hypothetical protein ACQKIE_07250 [Luteibacter sp. NPDC031894]|uniref:hypothetical protein n=1 Tax=Luteibacter sp. NPDC031894 TaxID=3390572 RepID=UPI003D071BF2
MNVRAWMLVPSIEGAPDMQPMHPTGTFTAGCRLRQSCSNTAGNCPSGISDPAEIAKDLPDTLKRQLLSLNMSAVDLEQLDNLAANLYWEGMISEEAFVKISLLRLDHEGPVDVLTLMRESLE